MTLQDFLRYFNLFCTEVLVQKCRNCSCIRKISSRWSVTLWLGFCTRANGNGRVSVNVYWFSHSSGTGQTVVRVNLMMSWTTWEDLNHSLESGPHGAHAQLQCARLFSAAHQEHWSLSSWNSIYVDLLPISCATRCTANCTTNPWQIERL